MNIKRAELLRTWVAALRSGQYAKTVGTGRRGDSYCTVGVLADVSGFDKWDTDGITWTYGPYDPCRWITEENVHRFIEIVGDKVWKRVIDMNDGPGRSRRYSFSEIADYIESQFPDIFGEKVEPEPRVPDAECAMSERTYTEREYVLGMRQAFTDGWNAQNLDYPVLEAAKRYPLPKVTRLRVVKEGSHQWRCLNGEIQWRLAEPKDCASGWKDLNESQKIERCLITFPDPHRIKIWADLLNNPTEQVDE